MSSTGLGERFLRQRAADGRGFGETAGLEEALAAQVAAARAGAPGLALSDEDFVAHLARRLPAEAGLDDLRAMRAAELYLARACAAGEAAALQLFEARCFGEIDAAGARLRAPADALTEVKQMLRRILFVGEGGRAPAVDGFAGRGDLRGWVRVAAVRELQRLLARGNREVRAEDDTFLDLLASVEDPELGYVRERYRRELGEALGAAIAAATPRERALLRYNVLEGLNIEEIGKIYGVHRATIARWIAAARQGILERTRAELARRFGIAADDVDSIVRLVQSRLDVSMERVLG